MLKRNESFNKEIILVTRENYRSRFTKNKLLTDKTWGESFSTRDSLGTI